jgi:DNA-binding CsgD family transcriptional regulator
MKLTLNETDLRRVVRVVEALGRPLPSDWLLSCPELTGHLQCLFSADFLGTTSWNAAGARVEDALCVGRDIRMAQDYQAEFQFCDPVSALARSCRGPRLLRELMPEEELRKTPYFNEFLRPYDTVDGLDLHVVEGHRVIGDLRIWRGKATARFGEREVALLRLLEPAFATAFRRRSPPDADLVRQWFPVLTRREAEVAVSAANGRTDRSIAQALGLSVWTVRTHLARVFAKLEVGSRTELANTVYSPDRKMPT